MTISQTQIDAMDECAEYAAYTHPLPHPQPARMRLAAPVSKPAQVEHDEPDYTGPRQEWLVPVVVITAWVLIFTALGYFSGHMPDLTNFAALFGRGV